MTQAQLENYTKRYKKLEILKEKARTDFLLTLGIHPNTGFTINGANAQELWRIEKSYDNDIADINRPLLARAKYCVGQTIEFTQKWYNSSNNNPQQKFTGQIESVFMSHSGSGEICYNIKHSTMCPRSSHHNPMCTEDEVVGRNHLFDIEPAFDKNLLLIL